MSGGGSAVWRQRIERYPVSSGRARGPVRLKRQGGDRRSQQIEAHAELITFSRGRQERHYACGTAGAAKGARRRRRHRHTGGSSACARSRAKKKSARTAEQRRSAAVNAAREAWFEEDNFGLDPTRIVFIDETAANDARWLFAFMVVRPGSRSDAAPPCPIMPLENHHLHRLSALRRHRCAHGPRRPDERRGPFSPMSNEPLVPELRRPRDIIIMDKSARSQGPWRPEQAIEAAGAKPATCHAYSPDFNPIEMAFAKLKALLRAAAARTHPRPLASYRRRPSPLHPRKRCANYLAAATCSASSRAFAKKLSKEDVVVVEATSNACCRSPR